jgi:hypothetical protein
VRFGAFSRLMSLYFWKWSKPPRLRARNQSGGGWKRGCGARERLREIERPEGIAVERPRARVCFKFASIGCNTRERERGCERANEMLD